MSSGNPFQPPGGPDASSSQVESNAAFVVHWLRLAVGYICVISLVAGLCLSVQISKGMAVWGSLKIVGPYGVLLLFFFGFAPFCEWLFVPMRATGAPHGPRLWLFWGVTLLGALLVMFTVFGML